jgi:hypothetical protein
MLSAIFIYFLKKRDMFDEVKNSNLQGTIGLSVCITYMTMRNWIVSIPLNDSQPYDLVFDDGKGLFKVQVKTSNRISKSGHYMVTLRTCTYNFSKDFDPTQSDFLYILCGNGIQYMIPTGEVTARTGLTLGSGYDKYIVK